jgi:small subunit ribosomal protein S18
MLTERGKIKPRGATGTTAKFQRMLTTAVKRARFMALISPTKL